MFVLLCNTVHCLVGSDMKRQLEQEQGGQLMWIVFVIHRINGVIFYNKCLSITNKIQTKYQKSLQTFQ